MVPKDRLTNAVALNSASFNAGRLIGPAVAGLVIAALGTGWALLVNGLSFAFVLASLLAMRVRDLTPAPRARGKGQIRQGLRLRAEPTGRHAGDGAGLRPRHVRDELPDHHGADGHQGVPRGPDRLRDARLDHGHRLPGRRPARGAPQGPRLRILLVALAGFTVASGLAALAPTYEVFALALIPTGLASLTALTTANAMVQLSVDAQMRGRVMALYMAVFMGGTPLGAPIIGWIGDVFGARWTIGIGTIAVGLSLVAVAGIPLPAREYAGALRVPPPAAVLGHHRTGRHPAARSRPVNVRFRQRLTIAALVLLVAAGGHRGAGAPLRRQPSCSTT